MRRALPMAIAVGATFAALLLTHCGGTSGEPVVVRVRAQAEGQCVSYSVTIRDERGRKTRLPRGENGRRPPPPEVVVLDEEGRELHRQRLSYG